MVVPPTEREEEVELLLSEMNFRLDELARRTDVVSSRAAVLVASATIGSGLIGLRPAPSGFTLTGVALSLLAALVGTIALFPTRAKFVDLDELRVTLYTSPVAAGKLWLFDNKANYYKRSVKRLSVRGTLMRAGYVFLTLAILSALIGMSGWG